MGYGKTTAVKDFLNSRKGLTYAWFSLSSGENDEQWMWYKFSQSLSEVNPGASGKTVSAYGLPETPMDTERVIELLQSCTVKPTVVVLDDYHESRSERMNRLLTVLARAAVPDLHLIVISRSYPEIPVEELILKGMCLELSQGSMEFNTAETAELFALNGFHLSEQDRELLCRVTDGWTAAVYLALLKFAVDGTLEDITEITRLMKSAIYDRFDPETRQILTALSLADSFTAEGAVYITENNKCG